MPTCNLTSEELPVFRQEADELIQLIETSLVGQWLHITSLAFKDWRKPFTDEPERIAHPYVWSV